MKLILCTIETQPDDFKMLAQDMRTYQLCGLTEQEGFEEVPDIPHGFAQRALPGHYGEYLTQTEITNFLLIESGQLSEQLQQHDLAVVEQYEIQTTQDISIIELYEAVKGGTQ